MNKKIVTDSYFDGYSYYSEGPYRISVENNIIIDIEEYHLAPEEQDLSIKFVMPGMTEAHCHLFLNGDEQDHEKRSSHLKSTFDHKVETAVENLKSYRKSGVSLVNDAGDSFGINKYVQDISKGQVPGIR